MRFSYVSSLKSDPNGTSSEVYTVVLTHTDFGERRRVRHHNYWTVEEGVSEWKLFGLDTHHSGSPDPSKEGSSVSTDSKVVDSRRRGSDPRGQTLDVRQGRL